MKVLALFAGLETRNEQKQLQILRKIDIE
jgi:hypothetical protein